jgi:hypothetical protein
MKQFQSGCCSTQSGGKWHHLIPIKIHWSLTWHKNLSCGHRRCSVSLSCIPLFAGSNTYPASCFSYWQTVSRRNTGNAGSKPDGGVYMFPVMIEAREQCNLGKLCKSSGHYSKRATIRRAIETWISIAYFYLNTCSESTYLITLYQLLCFTFT